MGIEEEARERARAEMPCRLRSSINVLGGFESYAAAGNVKTDANPDGNRTDNAGLSAAEMDMRTFPRGGWSPAPPSDRLNLGFPSNVVVTLLGGDLVMDRRWMEL